VGKQKLWNLSLEGAMDYRTPLAVAVLLSLCGSAAAQPEGTDKCQCLCQTGQDADGNGGRMSFLIYESAESSICPIFNDRSCEIRDPDTGEKHYGLTDLCEPLSDEQYRKIKSPPG
jgi:hypothetical protein